MLKSSLIYRYKYISVARKMKNNLSKEEVLNIITEDAKSNILKIPTVCTRGCVFCFNKQGGDKSCAEAMCCEIPPEDFKTVFQYLDYDRDIAIDGGDIFDYPGIYEIINLLILDIKAKGKNPRIEIISTFADFDLSKTELLKSYDNFFLVLSAMSFDTGFKNKIMKKGWSEEQTNTLKELMISGVFSQVMIWDFGSVNGLKQDLEIFKACLNKLKKQDPSKKVSVILSYPSTTKYANKVAKKYNEMAVENLENSISLFRNMFVHEPNVNLDVYTVRDLSDSIYRGMGSFYGHRKGFLQRIKKAMDFLNHKGVDLAQVGFVTSPACYNYAINEFPELNWVFAQSEYYGGDVVASSLLTFDDVEQAIRESGSFKKYVMTRDMLNETGGEADVLRRPVEDFERKNNCEALFF